jgi:hypothetical protein
VLALRATPQHPQTHLHTRLCRTQLKDAQLYVDALLRMRDKYERIIATAFADDKTFKNTLNAVRACGAAGMCVCVRVCECVCVRARARVGSGCKGGPACGVRACTYHMCAPC